MNIRIPYEKLDDVKSCEFISFILDKDRETIFRLDFTNDGNDFKKLFNYEQEFVSVPDEVYEKCDSVIFFPYIRKTKSWGTKVIMWKDGDFMKFNGGFEFVRNSDKLPNENKAHDCIERGKSIKNVNKTTGEKNLIYFTVFGNKDYVKLLEMLVRTIGKQSYKKFEILFITDSNTLKLIKKIEELKKYQTYFHVVAGISNPVDASMQKLKIYEWLYVNKYKNILFLDADILVLGDLKQIFESKKAKSNVFYSATHNKDTSLHKTVYHCLIDYTDAELKNFEKNKITAFNAGQFFFKNTSSMRKHFDTINNFISTWDGRYFFEQSFLNYYFNILNMSDTKTFDKQFQFVSINENQTNIKFDKDAVFAHFMGNATNGEGKLNFMIKHYGEYI